MVEAVMLWNEPNNLSHWDFKIDPDWKMFADMVLAGARAIRRVNPDVKTRPGRDFADRSELLQSARLAMGSSTPSTWSLSWVSARLESLEHQ